MSSTRITRTVRPSLTLSRCHGFTLIEMLIVIVLVAIFAGIAVPSFTTLIANTRTETTASELHGLLMSARANAVTQRAPTTLDASSWQIKQGGAISGTLAVPAGVELSSTPPSLASLIFRPDGSASQDATLCLKNDRGDRVYEISIQPSGVIRLSSAAACN